MSVTSEPRDEVWEYALARASWELNRGRGLRRFGQLIFAGMGAASIASVACILFALLRVQPVILTVALADELPPGLKPRMSKAMRSVRTITVPHVPMAENLRYSQKAAQITKPCDEQDARQRHSRGLDLCSQRRFVEALAQFEAGYRCYKASSFLYNMGRAAADQASLENDRARRIAYKRRAVYEWRRYLGVRPDAPDREEIEAQLKQLDEDIAAYDNEFNLRNR